jgi:mono/diheme cytochrome c family protein
MNVISRLGAAAALCGVLACASAGMAQTATKAFTPEQITQGAALYAANCESCHGVRMVGPQWAIDLTTFPRDQRTRFIDSVTHGKNTMPPWGDVLKPDEIEALWAYVVAGER